MSSKRNGKIYIQQFLSLWLVKYLRMIALFFFVFLMILVMGFFFFYQKITSIKIPDSFTRVDGIIVLTGGSARLKTGLQLLTEGRGKHLLISGVNPLIKLENLIRATNSDPFLFECCVDLGRDAINTTSNAEESAHWVKKNGYNRVFIVTSRYHMPRSLHEFSRKIPDIELIPWPVGGDFKIGKDWDRFFIQLHLTGIEYIKFLGNIVRNFLFDAFFSRMESSKMLYNVLACKKQKCLFSIRFLLSATVSPAIAEDFLFKIKKFGQLRKQLQF